MSDDREYVFEYPDEAGYPDGSGVLSQDQLFEIDDVAKASSDVSIPSLFAVRDVAANEFDALVDDQQVGRMTFELRTGRIALISTVVAPEYRGQGFSSAFIRRVLDQIASGGEKIEIVCPIIRTFMDRYPRYEGLVDLEHPGVRSKA